MRTVLVAVVLLSWQAVLPASADAPAQPASAPTTVTAAGIPSATAAGTTFTLPPGWSLTPQGKVLELRPPEADMKLGLIDVEAADAAAAVAAGWSAYDPGFKRPVRVMTPGGPRDGWEERYFVDYEVSPNEKLVVSAFAWRADKSWLVGLLQSSEATREKRAGPLNLAIGSLRAKGYRRETFAGKTAHPIDAQIIDAMKGFVAAGMTKLKVPGVGFSLIDGGKVVYEGGLGVRELGKPELVDADTLFIAASNTKALGTLLLAELVDERKLRWDEPVTEALPGLQAWQRRHHPQGAREASGVRVHRHAPSGSGLDIPRPARDSTQRAGPAWSDAAHQRVRRSLPVQQSDGRCRRLHRRQHCDAEHRTWHCVRSRPCGRKCSIRSG